jgi:DNA-binding MarR family transcriptional regulator
MDETTTTQHVEEATRRLDVALSRLRAALARDVGISVPELLALENLDADGGLGPSELARRLQLSTGAVTALVDRLEARGHVARTAHPSDRRRVVVTLTSEAGDALAAEIESLDDEVRALVGGLGEQDRKAVIRFLDAYTGIIERAAARACSAGPPARPERSTP